MAIAVALAITGIILVVVTMVLKDAASRLYWKKGGKKLSTGSWIAFWLAIGFFIAATWTAALAWSP